VSNTQGIFGVDFGNYRRTMGWMRSLDRVFHHARATALKVVGFQHGKQLRQDILRGKLPSQQLPMTRLGMYSRDKGWRGRKALSRLHFLVGYKYDRTDPNVVRLGFINPRTASKKWRARAHAQAEGKSFPVSADMQAQIRRWLQFQNPDDASVLRFVPKVGTRLKLKERPVIPEYLRAHKDDMERDFEKNFKIQLRKKLQQARETGQV